MSMFKRLGRLFTIKTRFEAFLVTYAIAVGAVERGVHYMQQYPGTMGLVLALCCTGVVFLAGGKLLDSVLPVRRIDRDAIAPSVPLTTVKLPAPANAGAGTARRQAESAKVSFDMAPL